MISSMLDPRHKHLGFLTSTQKMAASAKLVELGAAVETGRAAIPQAGGDEATNQDSTCVIRHGRGQHKHWSRSLSVPAGLCYDTTPWGELYHSMLVWHRSRTSELSEGAPPTPGLHPYRLV